jgi:hypothetical protein
MARGNDDDNGNDTDDTEFAAPQPLEVTGRPVDDAPARRTVPGRKPQPQIFGAAERQLGGLP